jgi:hypothetical protein
MFVKTIKISLSEQRFKKFDSLHIKLKTFHTTLRPIFTFHTPSSEIHFTGNGIVCIIKKTFPRRYHSAVFSHSNLNERGYLPLIVPGQQTCVNCCNLLGYLVTDVLKYQ